MMSANNYNQYRMENNTAIKLLPADTMLLI